MKGAYDDAVDECFTIQRVLKNDSEPFALQEKELRAAFSTGGIRAFWREKLRTNGRFFGRFLDPYSQAEYRALLGEKVEAIASLNKAIE